MRTTLTLDDDVAQKLQAEARRSGQPFRQVVNDTLRRGFLARSPQEPRVSFIVRPFPMEARPGVDLDNVERLLDTIDSAQARAVILADANLLLYAYDSSSAHHRVAVDWLERSINGDEPFGLASSTIVAFLRLATHPRVFRRPLAIEQALDIVDELIGAPNTVFVTPGDRHLRILDDVLRRSRATSDLVPDAHLAALALEHHAVVHTNDHDFDRFAPIPVAYPLASPPRP